MPLTMRHLLQDLVDLHVFAGAQRVVADLRSHDCTAALAWCDEHRSRLKKGKNKFEFRLRMQARLNSGNICAMLELCTHACLCCQLFVTSRQRLCRNLLS